MSYNRESFGGSFSAPAMIPSSDEWKGANFSLPNNLQKTVADNAAFLDTAKNNLVGTYDENGKLQSDGLLGRAINKQNTEHLKEQQQKRINEAKETRNKAILGAISNIDALSLKKRDIDITNATGIPDAEQAREQFTNAIQNMGFSSIEDFANTHSEYSQGRISMGTPRYTQLKKLFDSNPSFVSAALAIYSADQNYNRKMLNPLTEQDKIDSAILGLETGLYQNFDAAQKDMNLRDSNLVNKATLAAELGVQSKNAFINYVGGKGNPTTTSSPGYTSSSFRQFSSKQTTANTTQQDNTDTATTLPTNESSNGQVTNSLDEKNLKNYNFLPKTRDLIPNAMNFDEDTGEYEYLQTSSNLINSVNQKDTYGMLEPITELARNVHNYEQQADQDYQMLQQGKKPNNIDNSYKLAQNVIQSIENTQKELEDREKNILATNNKAAIKEFNKEKRSINSALNVVKRGYLPVIENYEAVLKNKTNDNTSDTPQSPTQDIAYDKAIKGESLDNIIKDISNQNMKDGNYEILPNGEVKPSQEVENLIKIKQTSEEVMKAMPKSSELGSKSRVAIPILAIAKIQLDEGSYEDFKKQVLANKEALPTLSEINANIKNNSMTSTWKNLFGEFYEGKGELLQKDGKGISYSKFVDGLTLFSKEFAKVNKFDINEPTFYYLANLVYSNIKKD